MRRISWTDQRMSRSGWFFWALACCLALNGSHHGEGQHDEGDVAMPAVPGSGLVMVETEFVLGCLEAVLDRPTMTFNAHQRLDRGSCRTPCAEVGEVAISDMAPDQQAACP